MQHFWADDEICLRLLMTGEMHVYVKVGVVSSFKFFLS